MKQLIDLFHAHEVWGTLMLTTVWTAFVGSFDAPTKDSKPFYRWVFKFLNLSAGNIQRANSTSIEQSPNFHDAVNSKLSDAGRAPLGEPAKTVDWQQDQPAQQEKK